ncbi:MAG: hypothetical protein ACI9T8_000288 [Candidatus Saccharimonadales bacterium]|jgi:hypothetical protein
MQEQKYSQKYTVVCFIEPRDKFDNFSASDWPLHVTILDTFKSNIQIDELCDRLREYASKTATFDALPIKQAMLGEEKDVPVKLLKVDRDIASLHSELLKLSDKSGIVFNTPEFTGKGFLPHVTDRKLAELEIGTPYRLVSISLIDMFPDGDYMQRRVVDTYRFNLG